MCDAAQIPPAEHRRDGLELDRRGCRVAFCGERAKDRRGKSKVGETGQVGNSLSVSVCRQCVHVNALRGRETTRAIRAVQMSAGDKDRSASTASLVRSRRPDHVTRPRSTNTARLICWRIWRDQVPATLSAARGISTTLISWVANYVGLGLWGRASHGLGSRDTDTAERPFIGAKLLEPARSRKRDNPDPHEDKAARRC